MTKPDKQAASRRAQRNKGLAEMALLILLRARPLYGLELLQRLNAEAGLEVADGTIYPMLHRLEKAGEVEAVWRTDTENGRPRKYYALTVAGRETTTRLIEDWRAVRARLDQLIKEAERHD